jgi:hypothetical protein
MKIRFKYNIVNSAECYGAAEPNGVGITVYFAATAGGCLAVLYMNKPTNDPTEEKVPTAAMKARPNRIELKESIGTVFPSDLLCGTNTLVTAKKHLTHTSFSSLYLITLLFLARVVENRYGGTGWSRGLDGEQIFRAARS